MNTHDTECTQCGQSTEDGEGYDGLCGNCADVAQELMDTNAFIAEYGMDTWKRALERYGNPHDARMHLEDGSFFQSTEDQST